jgi:Tfp pilus assembly protein PilN
MTARKKSDQINLVPKDKFNNSFAGRILAWAMSTFRFTVIIVEMIVMLAFLSRFWLDQQNSDLDDQIEQKMAQIQAQEALEKEFNLVQQRLNIFTVMASSDKSRVDDIENIASQLPTDVYLNNISFTNQGVRIAGYSLSEISIAQFIVNLDSVDNFETVDLTQVDIDSENESLLKFSLNITII